MAITNEQLQRLLGIAAQNATKQGLSSSDVSKRLASVTDTTGTVGRFDMPNVRYPEFSANNALAEASKIQAGARFDNDFDNKNQQKRADLARQREEQESGVLSMLGKSRRNIKQAGVEAEEELPFERAQLLRNINAEWEGLNESKTALEKTKASRDDAISALLQDNQGTSRAGVNSMIERTQRVYSREINNVTAEINARAATMSRLEGNYDMANEYIKQAVDAATAEYDYTVDVMETFLDSQSDYFDSMDSIYKDAYVEELDRAKEERDLAKDKALIAYRAGIKDEVTDEPMSILNIGRLEERYGVTVPFGYTEKEVTQFFADNPGASSQELQAALNKTAGVVVPEEDRAINISDMTDKVFKSFKKKAGKAGFKGGGFLGFGTGKKGVQDYIDSIWPKVQEAYNAGYTQDEIEDYIIDKL